MNNLLKVNSLKVKVNDKALSYEVYQMFNIYFQNLKIEMNDENYDYSVHIEQDGLKIDSEDGYFEYVFDEDGDFKGQLRKGVFSYLKKMTGKRYPWGTLIGIRPSKMAMKMLNHGIDEQEIIEYYRNNSFTEESKTQLCIDIAKNERKLLSEEEDVISVYIGMPYCPSKCLYCSFTSNPISKNKRQVEVYIENLKYEIEAISKAIKGRGLKIDTVYFGGGTPTAVNDLQFEDVMDSIYKNFIDRFNIREFTVECGRPDSINEFKLDCMKQNKVSRISINPQTMNDKTLKTIGRTHDSKDVIDIFNLARKKGHENINMDLIIGLPGEGIEEIMVTCDEIAKLRPESITVHGLSIKRGSILYEKFITNESVYVPKQDEIIDMFYEVEKLSKKLSMNPYYMYRQKNMLGNMENIGYAIEGKECIYNIEMIEDTQTIIAVGANGITKFLFPDNVIERLANNKDVDTYITKIRDITSTKIDMLKRI